MKQLERGIGLVGVVAISVSAMIGSGIFVLPGLAALITGPSVWLAYLIASLCALPAALSKAELATAMPQSGGTYVYIDRTFGPFAGTIAGMGLWLSMLLKAAFALVGFSAYLQLLAADSINIRIAAIVLLAVVVLLNWLGVRKVSKVQVVVVSISICGLAAVAIPGAFAMRREYLAPMFIDGLDGLFAAVGFVFVSYAGVTKIAAVAGEVKDPSRNIPLGMMLSLGIVTVLYVAVTLVLVGNVPIAEFADKSLHSGHKDYSPIYTLTDHVLGHDVGIAIAVLAIVTMTSMANAGLLAASRFPFAMARDSLLPAPLGRLSKRYLTPVASILVTAAMMAVVIMFLDVQRIAKAASAIVILLFISVNLAVVVLRESNVSWYRPTWRAPGYPWIHGFGVISGVALLIGLGQDSLLAIGVTVVSGIATYLVWGRTGTRRQGVVGRMGRRRELLGAPAPEAADVSAHTSTRLLLPPSANVLVPLFGQERSPEALVEVGAAFADGQPMEVLNITEVPEPTSLEDVMQDDLGTRSLERRVYAQAEEQKLDLRFHALATRDAVDVVQRAAQQLSAQWAVLEWRGRTHEGWTIRNPLGWLVNHLPCNLALFKDAGIRYFRKILVYAEPGPHDALVVRSADHFAEAHGADLTLVRFLRSSAPGHEVQLQTDYLDQLRQLCVTHAETLLLQGPDEVRTLAAATAGFDLLVTGAPPELSLRDRVLGTSKDRLMAQAACSVMRLQSPRQQAHGAMDRPSDSGRMPRASGIRSDFDLLSFLDERWCVAKVSATRKDALFQTIGATFATVLADGSEGEGDKPVTQKEIVDGLWAREKLQNTAIGDGLAMPHATLSALDRTWLGIFTMEQPVDYQTPDESKVDVVFVTLGPPGDRQTHLKLISGLARLVMGSDLLSRLRAAGSATGISAAVLGAAEALAAAEASK